MPNVLIREGTTTSLWQSSYSSLSPRKSCCDNVLDSSNNSYTQIALLISNTDIWKLQTATMASADVQGQLGQVLINFSTNGAFPEEESVSAAYVQKPFLAPALEALSAARSELEVSPTTATL
jgi:hypothetical protein